MPDEMNLPDQERLRTHKRRRSASLEYQNPRGDFAEGKPPKPAPVASALAPLLVVVVPESNSDQSLRPTEEKMYINLHSNNSTLNNTQIQVTEGEIVGDAIQAAYANLSLTPPPLMGSLTFVEKVVVSMGEEIDMELSFRENGIEDGARLEVGELYDDIDEMSILLYPQKVEIEPKRIAIVCSDSPSMPGKYSLVVYWTYGGDWQNQAPKQNEVMGPCSDNVFDKRFYTYNATLFRWKSLGKVCIQPYRSEIKMENMKREVFETWCREGNSLIATFFTKLNWPETQDLVL